MADSVTINAEFIELLRTQVAEDERTLRDHSARLAANRARLHAPQLLLGHAEARDMDELVAQHTAALDAAHARLARVTAEVQDRFTDDTAVTHAILTLLHRVGRPISKAELRNLLVEGGMPISKLGDAGTYFYTSLKRLRDRQMISEDREGNVLLGPRMK